MTLDDRETMVSRARSAVTELLRERGRETGANIGHFLRRELPSFNPKAVGFESLSQFLFNAADDLVVVGRKGDDRIWALGEAIPDRELERALDEGPEARADEAAVKPSPIRRLELRNFRACRDVTLDLAGLTALVGPNGSGKSTLLYGLSYASQITRGRLQALFSGPRHARRLRSGGAQGAMQIGISTDHVKVDLSATPEEEDTRFELSLHVGAKTPEQWSSPGSPPSPPLRDRPELLSFWPSVLLRLRSDALARPSEIVEGEPRLQFDGTGLPTLLSHLANADPARLRAIVEAVREIVPVVEETRQIVRRWDLPRSDDHDREAPSFRNHLEVKIKGSGWVPADLLSEGTLLLLGVLTVVHQSTPPKILLMDDVDRGLHPKAQRVLMRRLRELVERGGPQLVLTTHSPYILDELSPESVRVVRFNEAGTRVRALIDHPEWQEWRTSMTSGEFWTYVGEDWLEEGA